MSRVACGVALVCLVVAASGPAGAAEGPVFGEPVGPTAAVLMDVRTGKALFARDAHRRWPPASTTKILTAILALERFREDQEIVISPRAAAQRSGAALGLEAGERWPLGDLLRAMMVRSANDAAVAVAEAVAGSPERFPAMMNAKARRLGARGSQFVNPHGLHAPDHYSTAYDLAVITRYALRHPAFAALVRTEAWTVSRADRTPQELVNTNRLLGRYPGADGVKTGWTVASGPSIVASATRQGWQLLAVVLNSPDVFGDAERLLDYGFATFEPVRLAGRGEVLATAAVGHRKRRLAAAVADDVHAVVRRGTAVSSRVRLKADLPLPIVAGQPVGHVEFLAGQQVVARAVLVAAHAVGR